MQPVRATELSPEAQAFIIAATLGESEDDGADYNELYGGGHFSDYSGFPDWAGAGDPISHAAGRAQFEPATWEEVSAAINAPDFSPTWQDRGTWWLAQRDYAKRSGGRDLGADLRAGFLTPVAPALRRTWTSLDERFPARYRAALAFVSATGAGGAAPGAEAGGGARSTLPPVPPIPGSPLAAPQAVEPPAPVPPIPAPGASAGQAAAGGGIGVAALAPVLQWLLSWPIERPSAAVCAGLAAIIIAGIGAVWHGRTNT